MNSTAPQTLKDLLAYQWSESKGEMYTYLSEHQFDFQMAKSNDTDWFQPDGKYVIRLYEKHRGIEHNNKKPLGNGTWHSRKLLDVRASSVEEVMRKLLEALRNPFQSGPSSWLVPSQQFSHEATHALRLISDATDLGWTKEEVYAWFGEVPNTQPQAETTVAIDVGQAISSSPLVRRSKPLGAP